MDTSNLPSGSIAPLLSSQSRPVPTSSASVNDIFNDYYHRRIALEKREEELNKRMETIGEKESGITLMIAETTKARDIVLPHYDMEKDSIIFLTVGGSNTVVFTTVDILEKSAVLGTIAKKLGPQRTIMIDANIEHFQPVLDYLRTGILTEKMRTNLYFQFYCKKFEINIPPKPKQDSDSDSDTSSSSTNIKLKNVRAPTTAAGKRSK